MLARYKVLLLTLLTLILQRTECFEEEPRGKSLTIVFDTTSSMSDDLRQVGKCIYFSFKYI